MNDRYVVQIIMDNQQSAMVIAERVAKEFGIVVDVLNRQEIATVHPPVKEFTDKPKG